MRVLVADRNVRLLESISRTFAHQFSIQTAASRERCNELLSRGEFDLALISEKLADGPGLQLLGQIARDSPDTLRVFVARRARLELLRGKLGAFGLFRTLGYPVEARELLSVLTLARAGLEVGGWRPADAPGVAGTPGEVRGSVEAGAVDRRAAEVRAGVERRAAAEVRANVEAQAAVRARAAVEVRPGVEGPAAVEERRRVEAQAAAVRARAAVEQISLTSADAVFVGDVPKIFASIGKGRPAGKSVRARARSNSAAPRGAPISRGQSVSAEVRSDTRQGSSAVGQVSSGGREGPSAVGQAPSGGREGPSGVRQVPSGGRARPNDVRQLSSDERQRPSGARQEPDGARGVQGGQKGASGVPGVAVQRIEAREPAAGPVSPQARVGSNWAANRGLGNRVVSRPGRRGIEHRPPMRAKVALGATIAAVLVAATLSLKLGDTSAHVTGPDAPRPEVGQAEMTAPASNLTAVDSTAPFGPAPSVARRTEPKTDAVKPDMEPAGPQIAASATPPAVADPSTFGSEAYEVIYSN